MGSQNEDYIPLKYHFTIQSNVYMSRFERLHFQIHEVKQAGGMANRHQDLEDHHREKVMWLIPSGKHTKNYGTPPSFMCKSTIYMAMFKSYISSINGHVQQQTVSLPEGNHR